MPKLRGRTRRVFRGVKKAGNFVWNNRDSIASMASTAFSIAKGVAALVNTEKKFYEVQATPTGVNTTAAINCITGMATGLTSQTRNGNSIKATTLSVRGDLNWSAYTAGGARVRLMIIRDLQNNNGTAPNIQQILQASDTPQRLMQAYVNLNFGKRFSVLYDKVFTQTDTHKDTHVDWFYKFAKTSTQLQNVSGKTDPHISFVGNNATDTDAGHVYIVLMGDQTTNLPTFSYMTRLRFIDN